MAGSAKALVTGDIFAVPDGRVSKLNRYTQIIERIFLDRYQEGQREVIFEREDIVRGARPPSRWWHKTPKTLAGHILDLGARAMAELPVGPRAALAQRW
jgi:hypothetical protein